MSRCAISKPQLRKYSEGTCHVVFGLFLLFFFTLKGGDLMERVASRFVGIRSSVDKRSCSGSGCGRDCGHIWLIDWRLSLLCLRRILGIFGRQMWFVLYRLSVQVEIIGRIGGSRSDLLAQNCHKGSLIIIEQTAKVKMPWPSSDSLLTQVNHLLFRYAG